MGAVLSMVYVWFTGSSLKVGSQSGGEYGDLGDEADVPHPATGLTLRHRTAMVRTWDLVKPDINTHGVNLFLLLFRVHPMLQSRFKGFSTKTQEELKTNRRLMAHGSTVLHAITTIVDNLDDLETLIDLLETIGVNHKKRGIDLGDFDLLAPVIVRYLKEGLGEHWSPIAEEAWTKALNTVNAVIGGVYKRIDS